MAKRVGKVSRSRPEVRYDGAMSRDDAVSYLEAIVAGLRQGRFRLEHAGDVADLEVPGWLDVEVRTSAKKGRQRIRFDLAWRAAGSTSLTVATP